MSLKLKNQPKENVVERMLPHGEIGLMFSYMKTNKLSSRIVVPMEKKIDSLISLWRQMVGLLLKLLSFPMKVQHRI